MKKLQNLFWLSLLGHLLLILSFLSPATLIYKPEVKYNTERYMPAYIYQPTQQSVQQKTKIPQQKIEQKPQKKLATSRTAMERQKDQEILRNAFQPPSMSSAAGTAHMQMRQLKSEKTVDRPLLKLLYEATVQQLVYPQIAVAFRETGITRIKFLLHPDGRVTQISMISSSGYEPLDNAAMDAIHAISPVRGVNLYINKSEFIEAYIEFR